MICYVPLLSTAGMPVRVIPSPWKPQVVVQRSRVLLVEVTWCLLTAELDTLLILWVSVCYVFLFSKLWVHAALLL